jgi:hypothetical protein
MAMKPREDAPIRQVALFQTADPPEPFRKAVQAIHIAPKSGSISLQQRKMFNSLIKNAIRQDSVERGRPTFEITIGNLSRDIGLNSNNTQYVKLTINSLISTVVNWDYLTPDRRSIWKASGLLAGAELEQAVLRYTFSDQIRHALLNPDIYASIDMRITRRFRKAHSLALWENTVRYEGIGTTAKIPLTTFRELILGQDTSAQAYKPYKLFKSKVLLPCIREVNQISDHLVDMVEHKAGRSVVALQFRVTRKPEADRTDSAEGRDHTLPAEMGKLGVPLSEGRKLMAQYGDERVRNALAYTNARRAKKNAPPLDNAAAYFRKALAQGWELAEPGLSTLCDTAAAAFAPARPTTTQEDVKARYIAAKIAQASDYFRELELDDQTRLIERYNQTVDLKNLTLQPSKKPTKMAEMNFFRWLVVETWGEPNADDLLEFLLNRGTTGLLV